MLRVEHLNAGYDGGTHLHGITLAVPSGALHAIIGPNGAGKTTLLHTIAGLIRPATGHILLDGTDLTTASPHMRSRAGIGYMPQGSRIFASLTVAEHLDLAYHRHRRNRPRWTPALMLETFPQLRARLGHRGAHLSGGEQQMLALARALLTQPRVLLLDEPTEGLSPVLRDQLIPVLAALPKSDMAVVLVTPLAKLAIQTADQITVLAAGRVIHQMPTAARTSLATKARRARPGWADLLPPRHARNLQRTGEHP
jgi:branched-chain amino acid transport system ATP-binding protein